MTTLEATPKDPQTPSLPVLRQSVRTALDRIFDEGLFGANQPSPGGTLRGIDVLPAHVVRQKLARAAIIANRAYGVVPDFTNPQGFFEKLALSKFFGPIPMPSPADKLGVDRYIPKDLQPHVQPVPNCWQSSNPMTAESLQKMVLPAGTYYLKANNGSGSVRAIDLPVAQSDVQGISELTTRWLSHEHGVKAAEWWYGLIRPQIFLEEDLRIEGKAASDWKFHIGAGKILAVQLDLDRDSAHQQLLFDADFKPLGMDLFFKGGGTAERPQNFDAMCRAAQGIAAQFEFARVDFYNLDGVIYLGEITLAPMAGLRTPLSRELDAHMGAQWQGGLFSNPT